MALGASREVDFGDAEIVRDPEGRLWRGRADGQIEWRASTEGAPRALALGSAPWLVHAWSTAAHYVLFSARNGLLVALEPSPRVR